MWRVCAGWREGGRAHVNDVVLVFSVGGGSRERNVSPNQVRARGYARHHGLTILGVVGRDGGYTKQVGDHVLVIPTVDPNHVTPHSEAFQAVVWHGLVCHPDLMARANRGEGDRKRHVWTPATNAHQVCRVLLVKKQAQDRKT